MKISVIPHESHGGDLNLDGLLYFFYMILVLVLYIIGSIISLVQEKRVIKASKLGNESSFSVSKTFKVSYFLKIACMCIVVALIILCVSNIFF